MKRVLLVQMQIDGTPPVADLSAAATKIQEILRMQFGIEFHVVTTTWNLKPIEGKGAKDVMKLMGLESEIEQLKRRLAHIDALVLNKNG